MEGGRITDSSRVHGERVTGFIIERFPVAIIHELVIP
jgi:hypothetical protein